MQVAEGQSRTTAVFLLYSVSGFISLGYQVAWFRFFVDQFGSSNLTFILVLSTFIGGLGAGAIISQRLANTLARVFRLRSPLRVYGVIETLIGLSLLLTLFCGLISPGTWGDFPYGRDGLVYHQLLSYQLSRIATGIFCVLLPCVLMGASFPLLCYVFRARACFPASLYAWNTLGACVGVLACEFFCIPLVGHNTTLLLLVTLNLALGLAFLVLGDRAVKQCVREEQRELYFCWQERSRTSVSMAEPRQDRRGSPAQPLTAQSSTFPTSVAITCAVLGGLLSGALEGDAFKRLWFLGCNTGPVMSFISFWAILAIFLGSWTVRVASGLRLLHIKVAFILGAMSYAIVWRFAYPLMDVANAKYRAAAVKSDAPIVAVYDLQSGLLPLLILIGLFVFPAFYCISFLFPYVCNRLQSDRRHLGAAYGLNTIAFCLGAVAFTWLAPRVNIFYSLKLFFALFVVVSLCLLLIRETRPLRLVTPLGAAVVFFGTCCLIPADFDKSYFRPESPPASYPISALKSNGAHTTYVVHAPHGKYLYFDGYSMSSTSESAQRYMRLMAHFPLLAHPHPRQALLICFGVGTTGSAIAAHDTIEAIDIVELNDRVYETAPEFAASNKRVHEDPRVRLIHDDGRNFLRTTAKEYDLITSEPPPPMEEGVYRLYSKEYYQEVLTHLAPGGMMSQWLPINQMPREAVSLAITTFVRSFPHTILFAGYRYQFILLGSNARIDLCRLEKRFHQSPTVLSDLRRLALREPLSLLARIVQGGDTLRTNFGTGRLLSDEHNDFSHVFLDPLDPAVISYDPLAVLEEIEAERLDCYRELRRTVMHFGLLRSVVLDFPPTSLMSVRSSSAAEIRYAGIDWRRMEVLEQRAENARATQRWDTVMGLLQQSLAIAEEQPHILFFLLYVQLQAGEYDEAMVTGRRCLTLRPDDSRVHHLVGIALSSLHRLPEAAAALERASGLDPDNPRIHQTLGDILANMGKHKEAIESYDRSLLLDPANEVAKKRRARLMSLIGQKGNS